MAVKNSIKTLALFLVSMILGILACEGIIRLVVPQRLDANVAVYEPDDDLVFRLKKNFRGVHSDFEFEYLIETNSIGLRDTEIGPKSPGIIRFVGLGDSFSYANGVQLHDTYFKRLEASLRNRGADVQVINCAVPGNSLLQEIRYLKRDGIRLEPDAVLVGFYVGNDFFDSSELYHKDGTPGMFVSDGWLVGTREIDREKNWVRRVTAPVRRFAQTRMHSYIFFRNRFSELLSRVGLRSPVPPPEFCRREFSPMMQRGWEYTQELFLDLSVYAQAHNIRLHVILLPTIYQVYPQVWEQYVRTNGINPDEYDLDKPQTMLRTFLEQNNINCIDVLPAMRRNAAAGGQLFFPVDSHFSPDGHRVVADSLSSYLMSRGG